MVRILMSGFETGDTLACGADAVGNVAGVAAVVSATPTARTGTYCFKGSMTASIAGSQAVWTAYCARKAFAHASKTEVWYAFGFYAHHGGESTATPTHLFFAARDTSGNVNTYLALDSGVIRAYYATAGSAAPSGNNSTLIAAASASMSMDAWHLIEVRLVAATGNTGNCEVYLDGVSIISTSSQRTCQTNANFGSFDLGWIINGAANTGAVTTTLTYYHAFDDVRINDTTGAVNNARPNDGGIRALVPNAVGTTIGGGPLTPSTGVNNWANVDDIPPNGTTDYNSSATVGAGETYNFADPSGVGSVQAIGVIVQAFNADGGGGSVGITTKTGAGTTEAAAQPITGLPTYYTQLYDTDPNDSGAWTAAKINALECGITVR